MILTVIITGLMTTTHNANALTAKKMGEKYTYMAHIPYIMTVLSHTTNLMDRIHIR